jgi:hypothetical protein
MTAHTKRNESLRPETIEDELRDEAEALAWARAAEDPEFRRESAEIAAAYDPRDRLPTRTDGA